MSATLPQVTVGMPLSLLAWVDEQSDAEGLSRSKWIVEVIQEKRRAFEQGEPVEARELSPEPVVPNCRPAPHADAPPMSERDIIREIEGLLRMWRDDMSRRSDPEYSEAFDFDFDVIGPITDILIFLEEVAP